MQAMPLMYPRWLYAELRNFATQVHGCSLRSYVQAQRARCFSEFNALGAFAWFYYPDAFFWINTVVDSIPEPLTRIFWSWGGVTPKVRKALDAVLA
jgi:hypothetical protein